MSEKCKAGFGKTPRSPHDLGVGRFSLLHQHHGNNFGARGDPERVPMTLPRKEQLRQAILAAEQRAPRRSPCDLPHDYTHDPESEAMTMPQQDPQTSIVLPLSDWQTLVRSVDLAEIAPILVKIGKQVEAEEWVQREVDQP